jgi:hypothetical protein
VSKADELGVKLRANFTRLYDEIRYSTGDVKGTRTIRPIRVLLFRDGSFRVTSAENRERESL